MKHGGAGGAGGVRALSPSAQARLRAGAYWWVPLLKLRSGDRIVMVTRFRGPTPTVFKKSVVRATVRPRSPRGIWERVEVHDELPRLISISLLHPHEEGIEWARGWRTAAAQALRALVAL